MRSKQQHGQQLCVSSLHAAVQLALPGWIRLHMLSGPASFWYACRYRGFASLVHDEYAEGMELLQAHCTGPLCGGDGRDSSSCQPGTTMAVTRVMCCAHCAGRLCVQRLVCIIFELFHHCLLAEIPARLLQLSFSPRPATTHSRSSLSEAGFSGVCSMSHKRARYERIVLVERDAAEEDESSEEEDDDDEQEQEPEIQAQQAKPSKISVALRTGSGLVCHVSVVYGGTHAAAVMEQGRWLLYCCYCLLLQGPMQPSHLCYLCNTVCRCNAIYSFKLNTKHAKHKFTQLH